MIKLNNKNITYVALADSNNSLKAPKEIWYADSNNSVKLVYRRKDALIEGEDYEKYHWLEGTNDTYISGVKYNVWQNKIQIKVGEVVPMPSATNYGYFVLKNGTNQPNLSIYKNVQNNQDFLQVIFRQSQGHIADIVPYQGFGESTMTFYVDNGVATVEQDGFVYSGESLTESTWNTDIELSNINNRMAKVSYIREVLPNNTYRSNLIPCKLLKPVPKWLDANGIRRQVGECGMIDLVSGKFYGNVNSVGTFTVENYYERKEWLVGDGSAFLSTTNGLTGLNSVEWELSGNGHAALNSFGLTTGAAQFVSDLSYVDGSIGKIGIYDNNRGYIWTTKLDVNTLRLVSGTTIKAITINDVDLSNPNYQWNGYFILQFINKAAGYKVSEVTVDGVIRYVPCTLTMDLPASMDANNIARTKGTSGMWDLVSDRFYGNVANSGTFKAVNLAEGTDYEVHQWLITENSNGDYMMSLPLNTYDFSLKRRILELDGNCYHFLERGNTLHYFTTPTYVTKVYEDGVPTFSSIAQTSFGDDIEIKSTNNSLTFNGEDVPIPDSYFTYLRFKKSVSGTIMKISTSSITVDGIERYIPVKLLRPIPAKYDANGRARQAGECGMYDTVNDVFYGNVASSGTFTVSDDS